jgi:integrase/recombinase XerC
MSVRKNKYGTYTSDTYDIHTKKIAKNFKLKSDASAFETKNKNEKRELKLVQSKLKQSETLFTQALNEFMNPKLNLRTKTVGKYKYIIKQFQLFINSEGLKYVSEFTPDHATKLYIQISSAKPKTVNGFLALVRAFFKEEVLKQHIIKSPMIHIKNLKVQKNKPEFYTEEELRKFFAQPMDASYRLAFKGLLHTGMRIEELANIHWSDIDFEKRLIRVQRKAGFEPKTSNSERAIPMTQTLIDDLLASSANKKSATYVFTSVQGNKIRERNLLEVCKTIATSAGITSRAFLHKFRHTFATHLVINRVPLERVQKLLGHSSINETLVYAHLLPEEMHDDVNVLNRLN